MATPTVSRAAQGSPAVDPGPAVAVRDLVKRYPRSPANAVDGLSFTVGRGEVFALLGPNGAGKTSTVGMLTTRVRPTSGTVRLDGVDVVADSVAARRRLAVVPQRSNLDRSLDARENLVFHAACRGLGRARGRARADELLEAMGLADKAGESVDRLSGGQAQRLMLARALMRRPRVLFCDEPSTGLDPQARRFVHDRIGELRAEGVTVVLTTHDMREAAEVSDRVGIVDHGRLLALDAPARLVAALPGSATVDVCVGLPATGHDPDPGAAPEALAAVPSVRRVDPLDPGPGGARYRLHVDGSPSTLVGAVASALLGRGLQVRDVSVGEASLEDVFLELTGRELR